MYQYFIYFIVTLIIYSTYQPIQLETASIWTSITGQACLVAGFALLCGQVPLPTLCTVDDVLAESG